MRLVGSVPSRLWPLLVALVALAPAAALASVSISPSPSYTGAYTVNWTDMSGAWDRTYLNESLNGGAWVKTTVTGTTSKAFASKGVGSYAYKVQFYEYDGETGRWFFRNETPAVSVQVWKSVPAGPGPIAGPTTSESGIFALSWTAPPGVVTSYQVMENGAPLKDAAGSAVTVTSTSVSLTGRRSGTYTYQVAACNGLGCGPYNAVFTVSVLVNLTTLVADAAPPSAPDQPFAQGNVGSIPGKAGVDGGTANYNFDIEVPPGRHGMQPRVLFRYGSRNGNGIAGVGWNMSTGGSIYRCPRTLESDGANRPVLFDYQDRLCMNGQRLVQVGTGTYGGAYTEYRTEVEQFARIKLLGGSFFEGSSYFQVERKDGRVEHYAPTLANGAAFPDTWLLVREFDRQGNCIRYQHDAVAVQGGGQEVLLTSIAYSGTTDPDIGTTCAVTSDVRLVYFTYAFDREDKRTTYRAGHVGYAHARLAAIQTYVGSQPIKRTEFRYGAPSGTTRRSLLREVQLCAGASCGSAALPPTTFAYGEAARSYSPLTEAEARVIDPDNTSTYLGEGWVVGVDGDFDGDGTRDKVYSYSGSQPSTTPRNKLQLSSKAVLVGSSSSVVANFPSAFDPGWGWSMGTPSLDVNLDGRADLVTSVGGELTAIWLKPAGAGLVAPDYFKLGVAAPMARPLDFDGDGRVDLYVGNSTMAQRLPDGVSICRR